MLQNPERTTPRQYQIIEPIQLVAEIYPMAPALTCKTRPAPSREEHPERWPSGLRRTLGKRVCGKPYRGFESHSLRHSQFRHRSPTFKLMNSSRHLCFVSYLYTFTHLCYNSGVERG